MSFVSVIIPCYRQAHFLGEAIESVLHQTHSASEIIVVDDGSPDHTAQVVRRFPHVQYIIQDNQGLAAARNRGIEASKGEFLVFLDADDHLLPNHLEIGIRSFQDRPDVGLVYGDFRLFGSEERWNVHRCDPRPDHYASFLRCNFIGAVHSAMFRRTVVLHLGGFSAGLHACEDYELFLRLARTYSIHCHHQLVAEYRRHDSQLSRQWDVMLSSALSVLESQWPYVKRHPEYIEAYHDGVKRVRTFYGDPLLWQMVFVARQGQWSTAVKYLKVLLRFYPNGLARLFRQKLLHRKSLRSLGMRGYKNSE